MPFRPLQFFQDDTGLCRMYVIDNQENRKSACVLWYIGILSISLSISELYSAATPGPRTGVGGEESRLRIELPAAAVAGSAVTAAGAPAFARRRHASKPNRHYVLQSNRRRVPKSNPCLKLSPSSRSSCTKTQLRGHFCTSARIETLRYVQNHPSSPISVHDPLDKTPMASPSISVAGI